MMVRRMLGMLASEVRNMHHAAYVLGVFAFLSSLLAFLRDRLLAHTFGAGIELDLYYAAFRVPDLIFVGIASLVSAYVLIPELVKRNEGREQQHYIETVTIAFFVGIVLVSGLIFVVAPALLATLFPSFVASGDIGQLIMLTRIMLLQPILLGLSNILAAIIQARSRYILYAISPLLYNLGIMFGVVALYPFLGLSGLAWGVVLGAVLHVGIQLPSVFSDRFFLRMPQWFDWTACRRTFVAALPRTLALSMNQLVLLVFIAIAASMTAGSIAVFTFAFNFQAVPLAIIGASYSVAAFPMLARMYSNGDTKDFIRQVQVAARHIIFWSLPIIALCIVLRAHLIRVVLGTGAFDWTDTRLTAAAFALLITSLTAHALTLLFVRSYYAAGRSYTPLIVQGITAAIAVGLAFFLIRSFEGQGVIQHFLEAFLRVENVPGTVVLALPLAYSSAMVAGVVVFIYLFQRHFGDVFSGIVRPLVESFAAGSFGAIAAYVTLSVVGGISSASTFATVFLHGLLAGIVGLAGVVFMFHVLGSRELTEALNALHRRVWRVTPISSAEDEA